MIETERHMCVWAKEDIGMKTEVMETEVEGSTGAKTDNAGIEAEAEAVEVGAKAGTDKAEAGPWGTWLETEAEMDIVLVMRGWNLDPLAMPLTAIDVVARSTK